MCCEHVRQGDIQGDKLFRSADSHAIIIRVGQVGIENHEQGNSLPKCN